MKSAIPRKTSNYSLWYEVEITAHSNEPSRTQQDCEVPSEICAEQAWPYF